MDHQPTQDQMMLISQLFPAATPYTAQIVSQQGEMKKPRRRRNKKMKAEENGATEVFKKRKLSEEQMNLLEQNFGTEHKLDSERKDRLAMELGLDPRQVAVWFQNRRARWKNKKLEEEYSNLRKIHESTLLEKCRLETEVLKLREKLSEAEKEIEQQKQLENTVDGVPSNSSSSSHSQSFDQAMDPTFLGEFVVDGYGDDVFYVPDLEWINYPYM